jgi:hypothetical protein
MNDPTQDYPDVTFADGNTVTVDFICDSGEFYTAIAKRRDGFARCVFLDRQLRPHPDPWLVRPVTTKGTQAYRLVQ